MSFPGGAFLFAGITCALMNMAPLFLMRGERDSFGEPIGLSWREFLRLPGLVFVFANLLLALVGVAGMCLVSTAVIDKQSREVSVRFEIILPFGLPVISLKKEVYSLSDFEYVLFNRGTARKSSPSLSLSGGKKGVQLLGNYFFIGELDKTAAETAAWLGWELQVKG